MLNVPDCLSVGLSVRGNMLRNHMYVSFTKFTVHVACACDLLLIW